MLSKKRMTFLFTSVLALYPLLLMINVTGPLRLGDFLLIILSFITIIQSISEKEIWSVNIPLVFISLYVLFIFVLNLMIHPIEPANIIDLFHYLYALLLIAFVVPNYFDTEIGFKALRILTVSNSIIIIVQYTFMKTFGVYLLEFMPRLFDCSTRAYFDIDHPRPFGLFSEPSAFAWTAVIYLTLELFRKGFKMQRGIAISVTLLAMIFSKSASAIALLSIIFVYWGLHKLLKEELHKGNFFILSILLITAILIVLIRSGGLTFFIEHIYDTKSNSVSRGMLGRVGTLFDSFSCKDKSLREILFGNGIVQLYEYHSGISRLVSYWGYVGVILNYICCFSFFKKAISPQITEKNILIILACIYNIFSAIMVGVGPLLWMPYILGFKKEEQTIEE